MNNVMTKQKMSMWFMRVAQVLCLSWIFAVCAQLYIPLPFNMVPIYPHPFPLLLAVLWYRRIAVTAYVLYLFQGAYGLPFFARMNGGLVYMMGPTGGYLIGFLFAMILFEVFLSWKIASRLMQAGALLLIALTYFACGLAHLMHFVPVDQLCASGLFPFLCGDGIKLFIVWKIWK